MHDFFPIGCTIDRGCFIERRIDAYYRRIVNNGVIPEVLPKENECQDERPIFWLGVPGNRSLPSQECLIDKTGV